MRSRLGKVTVADVLAAQPVTTNLLKFMRASIKMIGVSNLQSFIASMTQKLTLSDISDESKNYLDKAGITTACLRIKSKWTAGGKRSEERFSRNAETDLVCRLLLEKKKKKKKLPDKQKHRTDRRNRTKTKAREVSQGLSEGTSVDTS